MYDLIVIGSGVAGLTAGIYASRAGKKTLIIENSVLGGTTATIDVIENYPGFEHISGIELAQKMYMHAINAGAVVEFGNISNIDFDNFKLRFNDKDITFKTLIIAGGISNKKLQLDNVEDLVFHGISYCAVCDGTLYKNKNIAVLTDGDIGKSSIDYLSNLTDKITVLDISNNYKNDKIKTYNNVQVLNVNGQDKLSSINFKSNDIVENINLDGLFISLGKENDLSLYKDKIALKNNFILTDENMATNIPGVFAAGDIRFKNLRQIVTACSDGAIAATEAIKFINKNY